MTQIFSTTSKTAMDALNAMKATSSTSKRPNGRNAKLASLPQRENTLHGQNARKLSTEQLILQLPSDRRFFVTNKGWKGFKTPRLFRDQLEWSMKPKGLWYAFGGAWLSWCVGENFGYGNLLYEVKIDPSKIYHLQGNRKNVLKFTEEFACERHVEFLTKLVILSKDASLSRQKEAKQYYLRSAANPDWSKLAKTYDGIEISPYEDRLRTATWYYMVDVPSGCIWRKRALLDVRLYASRNEKGQWELAN